MARINVDDCFFGDERIKHLAQLLDENIFTTRGRLLSLWHSCYRHRTAIRTTDQIKRAVEWCGKQIFAAAMVEAELATIVGEGQYLIRGVEERIGYLVQKAEAGKRSAEARKEKFGTAQPKKPEQTPNGCSSTLEPLAPSPALAPDLKEEELFEGKNQLPDLPPPSKDLVPSGTSLRSAPPKKVAKENEQLKELVAGYVMAHQERYKMRPLVGKIQVGQLRNMMRSYGFTTTLSLVQAYLQMRDPFFDKRRHDLGTLMAQASVVYSALTAGVENPSTRDEWNEIFAKHEEWKKKKTQTAAVGVANA